MSLTLTQPKQIRKINMSDYAPNIDGMDQEDLNSFVKTYSQNPNKAIDLFPNTPNGYKSAAQRLADYASLISKAMTKRLQGNIQAALQYENNAEDIYATLPRYARF